MKIYILFDNADFECPTIYGYFSSIEKAEEALNTQNLKNVAAQNLTIERMKGYAEDEKKDEKKMWLRMIKRELERGIPILLIEVKELDVLK